MRANRKYLVAAVLLALMAATAVVFGLAGTFAPRSELGSAQQGSSSSLPSSSSSSGTNSINHPAFDSGWVDIRDECGQYFALTHGLNTTEVIVDIVGKRSPEPEDGALDWCRIYGGANREVAYSLVQTLDGGYAVAGYTESYGAGRDDSWLVKTDWSGTETWNKTYGGTKHEEARSVVQTGDGGYALAGYTTSFGAGNWDAWLVKTDSDGNALWNQTYGGTGDDRAYSVVQTSDGGYALAGITVSYGADGYDSWLVKTDAAGNALWNQTYGGTGDDRAYSVVQTVDGGYALAGYSGTYAIPSNASLVKTDAAGNMEWNQTYGGANRDYAYSLVQTSDGGYALAGETQSYGAGSRDFWLVRTDSAGNALWNQTYGGTSSDYGSSLVQTVDGGYALAGFTHSYGAGNNDFWLVKTDSAGNALWNQTYGGTGDDRAWSLVQTWDGGYALAGYTGYPDHDLWLVKVDPVIHRVPVIRHASGWSKTHGGADGDIAYSLIQTSDGGYALAGSTHSFGAGYTDMWLVKTDAAGNALWNQTYGGTSIDGAISVVQTSDGGYALAGSTRSYGTGCTDMWLVKTDAAGNALWNQTYGGTYIDYAYSLVQTDDGGYAVAGSTKFYEGPHYDFCLVKTNSTRHMQWNQTYGGTGWEETWSMVQTSDGGYALAGYTKSYGAGYTDMWLVKTDAAGNALWNQTYGAPGPDSASSVVQTSDGGYAIAGSGFANLVKTDANGNKQWNKTLGGTPWSVVQTVDGGYALAGFTKSFGAGGYDFWLVKTEIFESGLAWTGLTDHNIILYRGSGDPYWNYVRVRIWPIPPEVTISDVSDDPDPFNPHISDTSTISYKLSHKCRVTIKISDSEGRIVKLLRATQPSGANSVTWDGTMGNQGIIVPDGTYKYEIQATDMTGNKAKPATGTTTVTS